MHAATKNTPHVFHFNRNKQQAWVFIFCLFSFISELAPSRDSDTNQSDLKHTLKATVAYEDA